MISVIFDFAVIVFLPILFVLFIPIVLSKYVSSHDNSNLLVGFFEILHALDESFDGLDGAGVVEAGAEAAD